jgi:hypothetical protein
MEKRKRERRDKCKEYLRRAGNLPDAMKMAKKDGFAQNASVWVGALAEMLGESLEQ